MRYEPQRDAVDMQYGVSYAKSAYGNNQMAVSTNVDGS
jgi:hypothetical protein